MKYGNIKNCALAIVCAWLAGTSAYALSITDPGVLGIIETGEPASDALETEYANTLLGQPLNSGPTTIQASNGDDHDYTRNGLADPGSGSVSGPIKDETGNTVVPAGYEYVLAKYDGPNGGDVLWYLGGAGITLPSTSEPLWANPAGHGYGISHFTVFNSVPDGGATVMLLGAALAGLGTVRRFSIKR
jgi:hypothetical protein